MKAEIKADCNRHDLEWFHQPGYIHEIRNGLSNILVISWRKYVNIITYSSSYKLIRDEFFLHLKVINPV